jgi:putative SOS response-associated peptidase YedK
LRSLTARRSAYNAGIRSGISAADPTAGRALAGLWDRWKDPATGEWVLSCTIIVSGASAWMEPYHDRMPVLLEAKDFDAWLDGSLGPRPSSLHRKSRCTNGKCRAD